MISHAANGETRRSISLDFRIPAELAISENPDTVLVPLALLRKGPLTSLDVRDDAGRAVPVLDRQANARWAELALASTLGGDFSISLSPEQMTAVSRVVGGEPSAAIGAAAGMRQKLLVGSPEEDARDGMPLLGSFALMDDLATSFVLLAEIPDSVVGRRAVVKFSYEDPSGSPPFGLWRLLDPKKSEEIESLPVADAASYHLELRPPVGVSARRLSLSSSERAEAWRSESPGPIAHINVRDSTPGASYSAVADLRPLAAGLTSYAVVAAVAAFLLFWVPTLWPEAVLANALNPAVSATTATALLAVPAFLLALLSRPPEHPVVSRVYFPVRLVTGGTALTLLLAAAALVMVRSLNTLHGFALGLLVVQGLLAAYSACILAVSDPPRIVKNLERLAAVARRVRRAIRS
ncbi:MAG: hypothetical protein WCF12_00760 [Propionicimonas sp.]